MNIQQLQQMQYGKGFIAALDQSGGSTPKTLTAYGIDNESYTNEAEMYDLVHEMRTRIITSPSFSNEHILGAILFRQTMQRSILGTLTANYLWSEKGIVPFLKIDNGLADLEDGVQLMKPIVDLEVILTEAREHNIFGTKMRSVIEEYNVDGIQRVVEQQFEVAQKIIAAGLVPIIEPEVSIHSNDKEEIEQSLCETLLNALNNLNPEQLVMLKLTLPNRSNLYAPLVNHPNVIRVVALSGGYNRNDANNKLAENTGVIASFSRALISDLKVDQTDEEFDNTLLATIQDIYQASIT